jgi:hypothetical protein
MSTLLAAQEKQPQVGQPPQPPPQQQQQQPQQKQPPPPPQQQQQQQQQPGFAPPPDRRGGPTGSMGAWQAQAPNTAPKPPAGNGGWGAQAPPPLPQQQQQRWGAQPPQQQHPHAAPADADNISDDDGAPPAKLHAAGWGAPRPARQPAPHQQHEAPTPWQQARGGGAAGEAPAGGGGGQDQGFAAGGFKTARHQYAADLRKKGQHQQAASLMQVRGWGQSRPGIAPAHGCSAGPRVQASWSQADADSRLPWLHSPHAERPQPRAALRANAATRRRARGRRHGRGRRRCWRQGRLRATLCLQGARRQRHGGRRRRRRRGGGPAVCADAGNAGRSAGAGAFPSVLKACMATGVGTGRAARVRRRPWRCDAPWHHGPAPTPRPQSPTSTTCPRSCRSATPSSSSRCATT